MSMDRVHGGHYIFAKPLYSFPFKLLTQKGIINTSSNYLLRNSVYASTMLRAFHTLYLS